MYDTRCPYATDNVCRLNMKLCVEMCYSENHGCCIDFIKDELYNKMLAQREKSHQYWLDHREERLADLKKERDDLFIKNLQGLSLSKDQIAKLSRTNIRNFIDERLATGESFSCGNFTTDLIMSLGIAQNSFEFTELKDRITKKYTAVYMRELLKENKIIKNGYRRYVKND